MLENYKEILTLSNVLAVASILVAFLIGKWYSKKHKLSWYVDTREFFDLNKDLNKTDLKITYKDIPLKSLAQSYVYIWNSGNEIIDKGDLQTIKPLQLFMSDYDQVFEYKIRKVTREVISPSLLDNKEIFFEYLDPKDGFVMEILHSSHETKKLRLDGVVKKINQIKKIKAKENEVSKLERKEKVKKKISKIIPVIAYLPLILGVIMISVGILFEPESVLIEKQVSNDRSLIYMGIIYGLLTPYMLFLTRRKYPKYLELEDN